MSGAKLRTNSALVSVDLTLDIQREFGSISTPFLLMIADQDLVVKNEGAEELFAKSPSHNKTKKHYPALHGLLCEPSPLFDEMREDLLRWVNGRA